MMVYHTWYTIICLHHLSYVATLSENIAYSMLCHRLTTFLPFTMYIPRCSCLFCVPMRLP